VTYLYKLISTSHQALKRDGEVNGKGYFFPRTESTDLLRVVFAVVQDGSRYPPLSEGADYVRGDNFADARQRSA